MYKTHRQNHDFQIRHFLVGGCHTPDAAYALLCDLKEDREVAIKTYHAGEVRRGVKRRKLEAICAGYRCVPLEQWPDDVLLAHADLMEMDAHAPVEVACYEAAKDELKCITDLMAEIEPQRRHRNLPLAQAHQAAQQEEWKHELIRRAENYMLTIGHVPHDHFDTMRKHPEFEKTILPTLNGLKHHIAVQRAKEQLAIRHAVVNSPPVQAPQAVSSNGAEKHG